MDAVVSWQGRSGTKVEGGRPHMSVTSASAQLPLAMAHEGDTASVIRIHGNAEMRQHLSELGFVEGACVKVVSRAGGDVIVSVKGSTFGLNRTMASKITVA